MGEGKRSEIGPRRTFGQPLENVGNKTTYEWIYNWVRDPKHYSPATYMPNLRLTDAQVADVATYLSTLKGPAGDQAKATPDQKAADDVLLDYLKAVMPFEDAKAPMAKWDPQQKQLELGQRAINRYGCFSCHDIKGFEKAQSIGTDLSEEGSKLVTRLDFSFVSDIPHTSKLGVVQDQAARPADLRQWPRAAAAREAAHAELGFHRRRSRSAGHGHHELPARNPTARGDADALGALRFAGERPRARQPEELRRLSHHRRRRRRILKLVADSSLGPPRLTPEGARVQPDWLYAFLRGPIPIRPWLDVRMPTFGLDDQNLNTIIRYFGSISNSIGPFQTHEILPARSEERGGQGAVRIVEVPAMSRARRDSEGSADGEPGARSPDGAGAAESGLDRSVAEGPGQFLPGTRMPGFWPDFPKSPYPQLGGDAAAQIRAIRDHLMTFKGGPSPKKNGGSVVVAATN